MSMYSLCLHKIHRVGVSCWTLKLSLPLKYRDIKPMEGELLLGKGVRHFYRYSTPCFIACNNICMAGHPSVTVHRLWANERQTITLENLVLTVNIFLRFGILTLEYWPHQDHLSHDPIASYGMETKRGECLSKLPSSPSHHVIKWT